MEKKKPEIKSWKNLEAAFAGESMAYQKYKYFADIARRNGDEDVAKLFEETASHEDKHARAHLRNLYPQEAMTTKKCLELAVAGEHYEYSEMYPSFSKTAKEEGMEKWMVEEFEEGIGECKEHAENFQAKLEKLAKLFKGLARVEKEHHDNYQKALEDTVNGPSAGSFEASEHFLRK